MWSALRRLSPTSGLAVTGLSVVIYDLQSKQVLLLRRERNYGPPTTLDFPHVSEFSSLHARAHTTQYPGKKDITQFSSSFPYCIRQTGPNAHLSLTSYSQCHSSRAARSSQIAIPSHLPAVQVEERRGHTKAQIFNVSQQSRRHHHQNSRPTAVSDPSFRLPFLARVQKSVVTLSLASHPSPVFRQSSFGLFPERNLGGPF